MPFDKTSSLMWDLFTEQFGTNIDNVWYFHKSDNEHFNFALTFFLEKLWVIPMIKTASLDYCYESTAYVSNHYLNKFSRNSHELLSELWGSSITIFQTSTSAILGSVCDNKFINLKGTGKLCQIDFFTCGGLDAVNVSVEYLNRIDEIPSIIDVSATPLELNKLNMKMITDHSHKIYQRYQSKTAIIANDTIQKSSIDWFNRSADSSEFAKVFLDDRNAKNWLS